MNYLAVLLLAALVFGVCFAFDRGFARIFRSKPQHFSGLSVRVNKRYAAFGAIFFALGLAAIFLGLSSGWLMIVCGAMVLAVGVCLFVYYVTFGVFYDNESFLLTTFGKKSVAYRYRDIRSQQLYTVSGNTVIELELSDGRTVSLQAAMVGVYPFLDTAFAGWLRQTGRKAEDCPFYDPANSCWFPPAEDM